MSNESIMVVATKYKLTKSISLKSGTWDAKGPKEKVRTSIIPREFVEERNSHPNNEIYVIDEDATKKMLKEREKNIIINNEKAKRDKTSTADLVDAIKNNTKSKNDTPSRESKKDKEKK